MTKHLLFSLIGGIILFAWLFLSNAMPNFHKAATTYTPKQAELLQKIQEIGLDEGMYMLGQPDPSLSQAEQKASMDAMEGQPWAVLNYHKSNSMNMAMPMIRGVLVCFVVAFLLFWLFLQQKTPSLKNRLFLALAVGLIGFFFIPYSSFIWYKEPDIFAYFADAIFPWLILGFIGHKMAPVKE